MHALGYLTEAFWRDTRRTEETQEYRAGVAAALAWVCASATQVTVTSDGELTELHLARHDARPDRPGHWLTVRDDCDEKEKRA